MKDKAKLMRFRAAVAHETWDRLKEQLPHTLIPMSVVETIAVTAQVVAAEWASIGDYEAAADESGDGRSALVKGSDDETFRRHVISGSLHALILSVAAMYGLDRVESVRKIQDCVNLYAKHAENEG